MLVCTVFCQNVKITVRKDYVQNWISHSNMYSLHRNLPTISRRLRYQRCIIPFARNFSKHPVFQKEITKASIPKSAYVFMGVCGVSAFAYYFFDKTYRFELIEYAREHKSTILKDGSWRSALALGLVDLYRESGNEVITLMHCGRFLGKLIAGETKYFLFFLFLDISMCFIILCIAILLKS